MNVGDYTLEDTVTIPFTTRAFATGIPTALVSGEVQIYEDDGVTQITAAETTTVSLDSVAGFNMTSIAATAANGFEAGKSYTAILSAGTVGGVSVIGEVVGHFTIARSAAAADLATITGSDGVTLATTQANYAPLKPTTAGRTLDVTATGAAGIDWGNVENPTTAVDLSGTDIQLCDTTTTVTNDVGVNEWNGVPLATTNPLPNAAAGAQNGLGVLDVNLLLWTEPQQIAATAINAAAFDTGAITATAIAAGSLNGKGDWSLASAVAAISTTLGTNGDNLGSIPWNASWDAEVQSECNDAITAYGVATAAALATVDTVVDAIKVFTDASTAQTGDSYALASGATGFTAIDTVVDAIKVITDALGATAAARLALSAGQIIPFTVDTVTNTHTPTTTEFQADDVVEATADHYNGRIVIFTSGVLAGQATDITDYEAVGGIGQFTLTALTEAPSNDDTGIIV